MASQKSSFGGIPPQAITVVLVIFVLGWLVSLGAQIFKSGYQAPTGLNETMIALVTAFFVAQQRLTKGTDDEPPPRRRRNPVEDEGDEEPPAPQRYRRQPEEGVP